MVTKRVAVWEIAIKRMWWALTNGAKGSYEENLHKMKGVPFPQT
jgi:hypothetical protein